MLKVIDLPTPGDSTRAFGHAVDVLRGSVAGSHELSRWR